MIMIFPYAGYMSMYLLPSGMATPANVGYYAGCLSSVFMLGRFPTAYLWGHAADTYGRIGVLQTVLVFSAFFSILFGTSTSFAMALVWRTCLGAVNALVSTTKTAAQEIGRGQPQLERRAMGLVLGMRSWALLMGPALGGFLAEPWKQYPSLEKHIAVTHPWIHGLLSTYPFLLPNLLIAVLCLTTCLAIHLWVPETLVNRRSLGKDVVAWWRALPATNHAPSTFEERQSLLPQQLGKEKSLADSKDDNPVPSSKIAVWERPLTRQHLVLHWAFSFVSTYIDEAFPLFCLSALHLNEANIGKILSGAGVLFAALQYVSFATLTHYLGLYKCLWLGCMLGTTFVAFLPLAAISPLGMPVFLIGVVCMGMTKVMHSLFFVSMAVAINKTVESHQRAKMNALGLTGNSVVKAAGPLLAGSMVAWCFTGTWWRLSGENGGWVVFGIVPILGCIVASRVTALEKAVVAATVPRNEDTIEK